MTDEVEEWRTIPSFPLYAASSLGRIKRAGFNKRRRKPTVLALCIGSSGYAVYRLALGNRFVTRNGHQLVCEAFHGPAPSPAHEVAHNDGVRANNAPANLRWATRTENFADKKARGTLRQGEAISWAKLTEAKVHEIRGLIRAGMAIATIARRYGVSDGAINGIRIGKNWKHLEQAQHD